MTARDLTTERDLAQLREATRAAHEATKDLRAAIREAREVVEEVRRVAGVEVDERIREAVAAGLADYQSTLGNAIDEATEQVFKRFDTITDTLLGETKRNRRAGHPSIPELIIGRRS